MSSKIEHVSDTALWVAVHRGREGDRPDALYKDPLALKLAGERGLTIARKMAHTPFMDWMMSLRTVAIDSLIFEAIDLGVTTIINLGAGLDTRPYRLKFPNHVTWIEVDFPDMIDFKSSVLQDETPQVKLERQAIDLTDRSAARRFYQKISTLSGPVLVLTEGLIPYLENEQVAHLADDLAEIPNIKYWIHDYREGGYTSGMPKFWLKWKMRYAPFKFTVQDWFAFFKEHRWDLHKKILIHDLAVQHNRPIPRNGGTGLLMLIMSKEKLEAYKRSVGFAMLAANRT